MKAGKEIMGLFIRAVHKYNALEKIPHKHGAKGDLYHSERHMLDMIAARPELNISEHAEALGVTKGAISQVVTKLEAKGFIKRFKKGDNDKAVYVELTRQGRDAVEKRKQVNDETLQPLYQELRKHPDDHVEFLIAMFRWIERHLDEGKRKMESRH